MDEKNKQTSADQNATPDPAAQMNQAQPDQPVPEKPQPVQPQPEQTQTAESQTAQPTDNKPQENKIPIYVFILIFIALVAAGVAGFTAYQYYTLKNQNNVRVPSSDNHDKPSSLKFSTLTLT